MRNYYNQQQQPMGYGKMNCQSGSCGYPQTSPYQQMPTQMMPAQFDPVKQNTSVTKQDIVVPVVHPSHTTHINQQNYKYMHSFPHTQSVVNQTTHQHFCAPTPQQMSPYSCKPCQKKWGY
ncbi:CotD family spore coat protein [Priestia koreensis]|uniref:CotD family spore coat protein n=1 Tax=Priestia koreensis TaxID=284581 RepID=UPI001F59E909|nr:CotD family spore coat protein [Priestia koreensis]MCM3006361.1 spore coat protein [Priestia koreensis]UNL83734.1 hypothetical protein IE339_16395 [Priestia koreensis]